MAAVCSPSSYSLGSSTGSCLGRSLFTPARTGPYSLCNVSPLSPCPPTHALWRSEDALLPGEAVRKQLAPSYLPARRGKERVGGEEEEEQEEEQILRQRQSEALLIYSGITSSAYLIVGMTFISYLNH
ncbi:hypothetical protein ILYODFUR_035332 [Ilyodon furcidens]|uniref:Uncharacterized protein n=1 Tax=Ilyodon furcidens TaxID=33524 RepID=A0ABV0U0E2_9TELE